VRRRVIGKRFALAVFAGVLTIASAACTDAAGPKETPVEQLLFLSTRDADPSRGIYRMNADGTGIQHLTHQSVVGSWYRLSLSRDGTRVAFSASVACGIWVMNTDGSNLTQLTNRPGSSGEGCNNEPRWSRDGRQIAFLSNRELRQIGTTRGLYDVYVMNADGTSPRNVSRALGDQLGFNVEVGSWTADGRVVFQTSGDGSDFFLRRTYIVNKDGTGLRPLSSRPYDNSAFWSPDGSKVAFISDRDGRRRLYVMNADGTGERALTTSGPWDDHLPIWIPRFGFDPSTDAEYDPWSPDGTRIAFERWGDASGDKQVLYVINADGSGLLRLSDNASQFNGWSPSGQRIAFTKRSWSIPAPAGIPEIFVVNADGTGLVNVTNHAAADSHAMWVSRANM